MLYYTFYMRREGGTSEKPFGWKITRLKKW